jgi:hypothetical protein
VTTRPRPKLDAARRAELDRRFAALREYIESGQGEREHADDLESYRTAIVQLGYPADFKPDEARPPRMIWTYWKSDISGSPIFRTNQADTSATVYHVWNSDTMVWDVLPGGNSVSAYLHGEGGSDIERMTDAEVASFLAGEPIGAE